MAKDFTFATEDNVVSVRSRASLSSNFVDNKDRSATYRRWSEKATVVRYSKEDDAYDIIVSTTTVSSSTKKTERTMRSIRSIIPTSVHQFQPGESVLIGYVFERRETPVILGVRAGAKSSLRNPRNLDVDPNTFPIEPLCDLRCFAETASGDISFSSGDVAVFECTEDGPLGMGSLSFRVECAVGVIDWRWSALDLCITPNCFVASTSIGENNTRFSIGKNSCISKDPSTGLPFSNSIAAVARTKGRRWETQSPSCQSAMELEHLSCTGVLVAQRLAGCSTGAECGALGPSAGCCENRATALENLVAPEVIDVQDIENLLPQCGPSANTGNIPSFNTVIHSSDTTIFNCGWFKFETDGPNMLVETTQAQIDILRANGCCPCSMVSGTTVTVRDGAGRACSARLLHTSPTVTEFGSNPTNAAPCTGSN